MTIPVSTLRALGRQAQFRSLRVHTPDNLSIAVQDWGPAGSGHAGSGRATSRRDVLLIHGYSQSHLCWLKQITGSLADELRLVTYDLRGHGDSDQPLEPHFYREPVRWADEVDAVIRQAGLDRPVLVFWSYAGRIALDYVNSRTDADLSAMVFVNATSKIDRTVIGPAGNFMKQMTSDDPAVCREATAAFLRASTARPLPEDDLQFILDYNMRVPAVIRQNLGGREARYEAALRSIKVPVLVLHGSEDAVSPPTMAEFTCSLVPHARYVLYPGVGHMPFWEAQEAFDGDLRVFLQSIG